MSTLYPITVKQATGQDLSLEEFRGQVILIINSSIACGLAPQYEGLEDLYQTYKEQGFTILDFPSDQFQDSKKELTDINQHCQLHFGTSFPRFAKVNVRGKDAHPLFQWLVNQEPGLMGKGIKWNFTKFLINRDGQVVKRFSPTTSPENIKKAIDQII